MQNPDRRGKTSMQEQIDPNEIKLWIERLRSDSEEDRVQAASELSRMSIRVRGTVRTRGSASRAASSEFPKSLPDAMSHTLDALQDQSPAVRREVAAALGTWGDTDAANILSHMIAGPGLDADEGVRRAVVRALGTIGGPVAVRGLQVAAQSDQAEAVRRDAISALAELALQEAAAPHVTSRGVVRTRGAEVRPRPGLSLEAQAVLATLKRISDDENEREYLRRRAEAGLSTLVEPDQLYE
jgi:HEAT repeat protein